MYKDIPFSDMVFINPSLGVPLPPINSEVSFIPMSDISENGRWKNRQTKKLRDIGSGYTPFRENDILFAKITPCMENGKGCIVSSLQNGIGFGSTEFHVLRAKNENDPRFILYWSLYTPLRKRAEAYMTGSAGQRRVPAEFFDAYPVPSLKVKEQRCIAHILGILDELILQTEFSIDKLFKIKTGLMQDLFTKGIDVNGQIRDPVRHPEQFENGLPKRWDLKSIDELTSRVGSGVTPRGGSEVYQKQGILFIRSQNVTFEGLLLDDVAYIDRSVHISMSNSELRPFDVLLNITGASIGRCCVFPDNLGQANVNQHVCAIRLREVFKNTASFLSYYLSSYYGQKQIICMNAGGNREGLNYSQLRSFQIPWPKDTDEIVQIVSILDSTKKSYDSIKIELNKYYSFKKGLMQDLLTGSVPIPKELTQEGVS